MMGSITASTIIITIMSMTLVGCGLSDTQAEPTVTTTATLTQSAEPTSDISDISDATRDKRVAEAVEWIRAGKRRNWKYEKPTA